MRKQNDVTESLSRPYGRWLNELLLDAPPVETRATCANCAMCEGPSGIPGTFSELTKCCTYWPVLPNFLVGDILVDESAAASQGRAVLRGLMSEADITPVAISPTSQYRAMYEAKAPQDFGTALHLRCPYYMTAGDQQGGCSIWRHRNGVCSTWFCKFERGAVGQTFWRTCERLFTHVERSVAVWAALEVGVAPADVFAATEPSGGEHVPRVSLQNASRIGSNQPKPWSAWINTREDYFIACSRLVHKLEWADALRLSGVQGSLLASALSDAYFQLQDVDSIPARLAAGPLSVLARTDDGVKVASYLRTDPQEISNGLFFATRHFRGQETSVAVRTVQEVDGVELTSDVVRSLVDFGILVPVKS